MKNVTRIVSLLLALAMVMTLGLTGCANTPAADPSSAPTPDAPADDVEASDVEVLNLWSFTDEVPGMVEDFKAKYNPPYEFNVTIIATDSGGYTTALDAALASGGSDAPDIFCAEGAFMKKYAATDYSMNLNDLGIDVAGEAEKAGIAQYTIDAATDENGVVKGLAYQSTGGVFIYRRSIATDVLGSDSPDTVKAAIKDWDTFTETARTMKTNGVAMVSGLGDIWHPMENSRSGQWVQDGKLVLDDNIMKYFELSKTFKQEGLMNGTTDWTEGWYADMAGTGPMPTFGFFGPAWLIRYVMEGNSGGTAPGEGTFGDWAVCEPTVPFYWGGTWLMANSATQAKKEVADFIRFITLDTEPDGMMGKWVLTGDTVCSSVVMAGASGALPFCGDQNVFDVFIPANNAVDIRMMGPYDETINTIFREEVAAYSEGSKDLDTAIADFKEGVANVIDVEVD
ncbi:MAG: ABC transporter substrate-binding protein [Acetanaerobacterium sp.]